MSALPSLLITGTDTGVGKTVVTALLARAYRGRGVAALPFKPVAAGAVEREGHRCWSDIDFLAAAAGAAADEVGLYRFAEPLSPHLAAAAEGRSIDAALITQRYRELKESHPALLVEGVGGIATPLAEDFLFLDLAVELDLPVVIVTRPDLGTLNHTWLTVNACRERGLTVAGLVVNRHPANPDAAQRSNPQQLAELTEAPLLGLVGEIAGLVLEELELGEIDAQLERLDLAQLALVGSDYSRALAADKNFVWHPFSPMLEYLNEQPHPLMITRASGCYLEDSEGRRYLDGISSLWVNVHGHRQPQLDQAVRRQLGKVAHSTLLGLANEPSALLAEQLVELTPPGLDRVFYSDSGSTAVEIALKVAFQYWRQSGRPEKQEFISFVNAYHGDTIGAVSVGGHDLFHSIFKALLFPVHHVPAAYCYRCPVGQSYPGCELACLQRFEAVLAERHQRVAAVICEPLVQGAAGILVQPPGYLRAIADLCRRYDVLLITDEVATGFGRTGRMFACEHEGVEPDIMSLAKGITGGYLPLAATLFKERIYQAFLGRPEENRTFFHGHTYTGNPLACAAALANIELMKRPEFVSSLQSKSDQLRQLLLPLTELEHVGDIRQCGLMVGIELVADKGDGSAYDPALRIGRRAILKARERGVIIRPLGDTVVLMPPLAISAAELEELVAITLWAIEQVT